MRYFLLLLLSLSTAGVGKAQDSTRKQPISWRLPVASDKPVVVPQPVWTGRIAPVYSTHWYKAKLGAICRQELKWDQQLPIAMRFRLGSVEACDKLEGKYGSAYGKTRLE